MRPLNFNNLNQLALLGTIDNQEQYPDNLSGIHNNQSFFSKMQSTFSIDDDESLEDDDDGLVQSDLESSLDFESGGHTTLNRGPGGPRSSLIMPSNLGSSFGVATSTNKSTSNNELKIRKDPLYHSNRFKFTLAEDTIL